MKRYWLMLILLAWQLPTFAMSYRLGAYVGPKSNHAFVAKRTAGYQRLARYLSQKLHKPVTFTAFYKEFAMHQALMDNRINVGYIKTLPLMVVMKHHEKLHYLATVVSINHEGQRSSEYHSWALTQPKSSLKHLLDLQGKRMGFVGAYSTSGFFYPVAYLSHIGILYPSGYAKTVIYHSLSEALYGLKRHQVDAISVWSTEARPFVKNGTVRLLAAIGPIPNPLFMSNQHLSLKQRQALTQALLSAPTSVFRGLPMVGFVRKPPAFYQQAFKLFKRHFNLLPKKMLLDD